MARVLRTLSRGAVLVAFAACRSQQCDCYDVAPSADYFVDLTSQPTYDADSGTSLPAQDIRCTATLTGPANVITYDVGPDTMCTKHGGDGSGLTSEETTAETNGCRLRYSSDDAAPIRSAEVFFHLNDKDETFLGGPDFQFDLECSSGTSESGGYPLQGPGTFQTRRCDG
ncbi:MAG TPA: hypothetical protein VF407_16310 [Polyangiaceae bacterium]